MEQTTQDTALLRKLQLEELRLAKIFVEHCAAHNIPCYILGGTLLGAVRHKGFIPWDDDIDICMLREDYDSLLAAGIPALPEDVKLEHLQTRQDYRHALAKLCSSRMKLRIKANAQVHDDELWIDIIPLDGWPQSKPQEIIHKLALRCWKLLIVLTDFEYAIDVHRDRGILANILVKGLSYFAKLIALLHISPQWALQGLERRLKRYPAKNSSQLINIPAARGFRELFLAQWFEKSCLLEFEDTRFPAPQNYSCVLECIYGKDYMIPPPENHRNWHCSELITQEDSCRNEE